MGNNAGKLTTSGVTYAVQPYHFSSILNCVLLVIMRSVLTVCQKVIKNGKILNK